MLPLHSSTLPFLCSGEPVLAGVSGGRDSVALLLMLARLENCRPVVCHVHHGIRGGEADRDALFTQKLAEELALPWLERRVDVPALAKERKISIEEAARMARQESFLQWKKEGLGDVVALAQHRDDQAETVLMNLCRGGGGFRGMKAVSEWPGGLVVVRPLIDCARAEVTRFLRQEGRGWVDDASNDETVYTRNALRHDVLPKLDEIMGRDVSVNISRAARLSEEQQRALEQAIDAMEVIDPQGRLFLPKVEPLPAELRKAVLFYYLKGRHVPDLSEECVTRVMSILPTDAPARVSLPGGWTASRKERRLRVLPPGCLEEE